MKQKKYFSCICGNEVIKVEQWEDGEVCIAVYEHSDKKRFASKWRHIKKILKDGDPYSDSLILDKGEFNKFKEFITNI